MKSFLKCFRLPYVYYGGIINIKLYGELPHISDTFEQEDLYSELFWTQLEK